MLQKVLCKLFRKAICLLVLVFYTATSMAVTSEEILVDAKWLAKHLNESDLVVVDARDEKDYLQGHIVGAVNIPYSSTFIEEDGVKRIAGLHQLQALFSKAGIQPDSTVVIYAGDSYINAGRVFWVMEVTGQKLVKLLNDGFAGWEKETVGLVSKDVTIRKPTNYIPSVEPDRIITMSGMHLAIKDENKFIIDSRSRSEYEGKTSKAKRRGHIPTAVSYPPEDNFIEIDGIKQLKPLAELEELYNIPHDKKVYAYCNSGREAALAYAILRQFDYDVSVYDGSWLEWGNDTSLPIE